MSLLFLDRAETRTNAHAIKAIKDEGAALVDAETWLESTVIEKEDLVANVKRSGETIHMGDLMSIASVKKAEGPEEDQVYKGRVCFRGDNVKDQEGATAIFQEMSSCPTTIHTTNSNVAYGILPGLRNCRRYQSVYPMHLKIQALYLGADP